MAKKSKISLKQIITTVLILLLVIAMGFSTKYVSGANVNALDDGVQEKLDSKAFADKFYDSQIVPYIQKNAADFAEVDKAIVVDPLAAGEKYGHRDGPNAAYSVPVKFTATAGEYKGDVLEITVDGVSTQSYLQVGPALNGTAIRDVSGLVNFGMFTNQLAYQDAGTKLNDKVRELVLKGIDPAKLKGKKLNVVGAFSLFNPKIHMVVPISLEVVG